MIDLLLLKKFFLLLANLNDSDLIDNETDPISFKDAKYLKTEPANEVKLLNTNRLSLMPMVRQKKKKSEQKVIFVKGNHEIPTVVIVFIIIGITAGPVTILILAFVYIRRKRLE